MKTFMLAPVIAAMVFCTASVHGAATVVSNLAAAHRAGTKRGDGFPLTLENQTARRYSECG